MYLISVPNLKEIHPGEGCFFWLIVIVLNQCKEEKYEEIRQFSKTHISKTILTVQVSDKFNATRV